MEDNNSGSFAMTDKSEWYIYYTDGTVKEDDTEIDELPTTEVQVILQRNREGKYLEVTKYDCYNWRGGRWWGSDNIGLILYLIEKGWKKTLFGAYIDKELYQEILNKAQEDRKRLNDGID